MQFEQFTKLADAEANNASARQAKQRLAIPDHELIRRIGEGAYGEVWLARNVLGGYRAVKAVFRASFKTEEPYEREFRGIQRFEPISRSNEGLVDVLQVGRNDAEGCFYYVMELADDSNAECGMRNAESNRTESGNVSEGERENGGGSPAHFPTFSPAEYVPRTLRSEVQRRGRLPPDECVQLGMNLSLALAQLHRNGLIHRDIKPANIIFVGGVPKLADIGLVTDLSDAQSFVGTEGFIPPEGPNTPQADIYSLGKVLYEISMGKDRKDFPEPATTLGEGDESERLEELNAVILKACASNPAERYQTAEELIADLALLNSGKSVRWKRVVERRLNWAKRIAGVAAVVAALAAGGYVFQHRQTREAERNLYIANMNLAQRDWDKANVSRLSELLDQTEGYPDKGFEWYYWQRQLRLDLKTFLGHTDKVRAVAFSPDGRSLVSGADDHTVRIWDVSSGRPKAVIRDHTWPVVSVAWSPDGKQLVTGSHDGTAKIRSASTGKELLSLEDHTGMVFGVVFSPDGQRIASVSRISDGALLTTFALFDAISGKKIKTIGNSAGSSVGTMVFSPDGKRLAASTDQSTVKVWEIASGEEVFVCRSEGQVNSAAFSPDGQHLATGGGRGAVVWDMSSGAAVFRLRDGRWIASIRYSPDGKKIATGGADQMLVLSDAATGNEIFTLTGHHGAVASLAFSLDGKWVATASHDGTVKLWNASNSPNPRTLPTQTKEINALAISPDGTRLATTTWGGTVHVWEAATGRELFSLSGSNGVTHVVFSPDGQRFATGNGWNGRWGGGRAKIWDTATGRELLELEGNGFVAFAPDGKRIATCSGGNNVTIWDALTGKEVVVLTGHTDWVQCGAFSPDGWRIATASGDPRGDPNGDRRLKIWDAITGRELLSIERYRPENDISSYVAFSPNGSRVVLAGNDLVPRVWDAKTGREVLALRGHMGMVTGVVFSPDGRRIVTASSDRSAKVWDALTGRELLTLEGHVRPVRSPVFSPDGNSIVTAGEDGLIKIWEAASPEQVAARRKGRTEGK